MEKKDLFLFSSSLVRSETTPVKRNTCQPDIFLTVSSRARGEGS